MPPNKPKILAVPLTVIIGNDLGFSASLPKLVAPERVPVVLGTLKALSRRAFVPFSLVHQGLNQKHAYPAGTFFAQRLFIDVRQVRVLRLWAVALVRDPHLELGIGYRELHPDTEVLIHPVPCSMALILASATAV